MLSSPRPWGCFWHGAPHCLFGLSLPHARGGVSDKGQIVSVPGLSSPRPWGCFWSSHEMRQASQVFPTLVGVFPCDDSFQQTANCLPHARGGVSKGNLDFIGSGRSSPRPWGCFRFRRASPGLEKVFPSHVGGFHGQRPCPTNLQVFPTLVKGVVWNQKRLSILIASIEREEQGTSPPIRLSAVQMQFDFDDI